MLESLRLNVAHDFATLHWLGNTGSVAAPITLAIACNQGMIRPQDRLALLGIGSGINCLMLGLHWQKTCVSGTSDLGFPTPESAVVT